MIFQLFAQLCYDVTQFQILWDGSPKWYPVLVNAFGQV